MFMKHILVLALGLIICGSSFAQKTATTQKTMTPAEKKAADLRKNAVGGYIRDSRYRPIEGVEAFIYLGDSANTIIASGYTDATGYFETNSVPSGKYTIKIVYPNYKNILVPGVIMKKGITDITLKCDPPAADTSINYIFFQPKPVEKVKPKKK